MYLGFFFALSHYHLPRQSDQQPWPQLQAAASADWGQGSAVARLISGFLNLQVGPPRACHPPHPPHLHSPLRPPRFCRPQFSLACFPIVAQIEHHFAPRLSPEYMGTIAPEVKALCEKHGIAYQARRRPATRRSARKTE